MSGAWAGGQKGGVAMQSSGVGNCINALALPQICRIPFFTIVSCVGSGGNLFPGKSLWVRQPLRYLGAMDVKVFRADRQEDVGLLWMQPPIFRLIHANLQPFFYLKK
ncbi:MAG: hypothetical protein CM1200mP4_2210 [Rhodospirillaceae bacterium]|nr:MAG: hypothetical protein CM1200mP4_2210 [Rhodospirillaceae bacterium]